MVANPQANQAERPESRDVPKESVERTLTSPEHGEKTDAARPVAEAIQGEVADVMAGIEGKSEKPSEKAKGRAGEQSSGIGGLTGDDQHAAILQDLKSRQLPQPEVMIKRIRVKIKQDIIMELKAASRLAGNLNKGSAQAYNARIARVRTLKHILRQLLTATYDFVKDVYLRLFHPTGKARKESALDQL